MNKFMGHLAVLSTVSLFAMPLSAQEIDEIIVSATGIPTPAAQIGASVDVITAADLEQQQITYLQDALKLKGINVPQTGGVGTLSNVFLRGLPGKYTTLIVDGVNMFDSGSNQVLWNDVTADAIGRVEILRGSQGVLYGSNTIAGVVSQFTAIGGDTENKGRIEAGEMATQRLAISGKGQTGGVDYGYGISHFFTDGISASSNPQAAATPLEDDAYENMTLNAKLETQISNAVTLGLVMRRAQGELDKDGFSNDAANVSEEFERTSLRVSLDADYGDWQHRIGVTDYDATIEDYSGTVNSGDRLSGRQSLDYRGIYQMSDALRFVVGADSETSDFENTDTGYSTFSKAELDTSGIYGLAQWQANEALVASFALRQDDHELFGTHETYRVTAAYAMNETTTLRAAHGTGFRAPSLSELYLAIYGNAALEPETSVSSELGVDMALSDTLGISATVYAIEVDDIIGYDPATFVNTQVSGTSEITGLEFQADMQVSDKLSVALDMAYTDSDKPAATGSSTMQREVRVPRKQAGMVVSYQASERLSLGGSYRHVEDTVDVGNVALEDYVLLGVRAAYQLSDRVKAYMRLENAADEDYEIVDGYSTSGRAAYLGLTTQF